ncbi:MAG: hypothetical protein F7C35_03145 [Desulfurococcales archaeon]|nr:hypothetical protein [Desulfurococcales archaeon]
MRSIANIIAGYTGEDPEVVRRILYRHVYLLTDLWLIEKKNSKLRVTPIGLYVIATVLRDIINNWWALPYVPLWIASRLEEWEKSLQGLRVFLENSSVLFYLEWEYDLNQILYIIENNIFPREASDKQPDFSEREVMYMLINKFKIKEFNSNDPLDVLRNISLISSQYYKDTYLYELHKENPKEFEQAILRHEARLRKVATILRECSYEKCPKEALQTLLDFMIEGRGFLEQLEHLDTRFIEKLTGWPKGEPSVTSALALAIAGETLISESYDDVSRILLALKQNEDKMSEFLATLIVTYALDLLKHKLRELSHDIATVSRYRSSVIPRAWALKDERYRELLSAILMLDKVLNEQLEFSHGSRVS